MDDYYEDVEEQEVQETHEPEEEVREESEDLDGDTESREREDHDDNDDGEDNEQLDQKDPEGKTTKKEIEDLLDEGSLDKKVRVKVDGEEQVMTIRELQKVKQLESASYKKMQDAAKDKRMAKQLFDMAQNSPEEFLKHAYRGDNTKMTHLAETILSKHLEQMGMSEEQREAVRLRQENEQLKHKTQSWEKQQQQEQQEVEVKKHYAQLEKDIDEAWSETKLPKDSSFRGAVAQALIQDRKQKRSEAERMGLDPREMNETDFLTPKQAANMVKENWLKSVGRTFEQMESDSILEVLGKNVIKKIQQAQIKRVSSKTSPKYSKPGPGKNSVSQQKTKSSEGEYQEWLNSLASKA